MMRLGVVGILLSCLLVGTAADARDMNGKFGIGYSQTLGGVSGIQLKYYVQDFVIEGTFGFDLFKPSSLDVRTGVKGSVGVVYNFARFEIANLGVGVRADIGWRNGASVGASLAKACVDAGGVAADCQKNNPGSSVWQFNVEIPLIAELYFTDHFAVNLSTGVLFTIATSRNKALPQSTGQQATDSTEEGFGFSFGGGSLFGSAGFSVYF
jgi:hypothetical protein